MNKEWDEVDFCMQIDTKVFFKLLYHIGWYGQYVKIAGQIVKFLEGQYLKKNLMDWLYFFNLLKPI